MQTPSDPPSSAEGSRARTSATPEHEPDSLASAPGFGTSLPGSFASYDPESSSWKTYQASLFGGWETYSETWPRAGTMRNGTVCQRSPSAPRTSAIASSSSLGPHLAEFPTPSATSYGSGGNGTGNNTRSRGRPSLDTMARTGMWPTPRAADGMLHGVIDEKMSRRAHKRDRSRLEETVAKRMWPTPTCQDAKNNGGPSQMDRNTLPLNAAVRMWPTPKANSNRASRKAMVDMKQWSAPALEQAVELDAGILPREFKDETELNSTARKFWPTPKSSPSGPDFARASRPGSGGDDLETAVVKHERSLWPTPTAGDSKASGSRNKPGSKAHAGVSLTDAVTTGSSESGRSEAPTGRLNPTWVEWLMGFPAGWTDCGPSATRSSRKSQSTSDTSS